MTPQPTRSAARAQPPLPAVPRAVMRHRWECLTFLHWRYDVDLVQRLLPEGLRVDAFGGSAWVGLVPFRMRVRPPIGPGASVFPETNVRTYVIGPGGVPGVYFLSLDAGKLAPVVAARTTWRLPYFWSEMSVRDSGTVTPGDQGVRRVVYTCHRRWPLPPYGGRIGSVPATAPGHLITVEVGDELPRSAVTEFEDYLTARFALWNARLDGLLLSGASHPPWLLRRVTVTALEESLVAAAGLPSPTESPVAHFSDGVDVRIGPPSGIWRTVG